MQNRIRVILLCGVIFFNCTFAQIGNSDGFIGYYSTPSTRVLPKGSFMAYSQNSVPRIASASNIDQVLFSGFIFSPLNRIETGISFQSFTLKNGEQVHKPSFSIKWQLPVPNEQLPKLSLGVSGLGISGLLMGHTFFFSGSKKIRFQAFQLGVETGAVYHRKRDSLIQKQVYPFLNAFLDMGSFAFYLENTGGERGFDHSEILLWKPFYQSKNPGLQQLSIGGGYSGSETYPNQFSDFWATINIAGTLGFQSFDSADAGLFEKEPERDPRLWMDFSPIFENRALEGTVLGIRQDLVASLGLPGFYWGNSFVWGPLGIGSVKPAYATWDRAWLQWSRPSIVHMGPIHLSSPLIAIGRMGKGISGIFAREQFSWRGWRSVSLEMFQPVGSLFSKDPSYKGFVPIHPVFQKSLHSLQFYVQGGKDLEANIFGDLLTRWSFSHSFLQLRTGWVQKSYLRVGFDFKINLSNLFQINMGDLHVSGTPQWRQNQEFRLGDKQKMTFGSNRFPEIIDFPWQPHIRKQGKKYFKKFMFNCTRKPISKWTHLDSLHCASRDEDGDHILNMSDICPQENEDLDGFQDQDGCPDLDNDADRIPDFRDQCPLVAEDYDGFEDSDGCPEYDNDQDQVKDAEDRCPNEAEDLDGFEDTDGCPEFDNDQDGVPDLLDVCPLEKGGEKENGCPEKAKQTLKTLDSFQKRE